MRRISKIHNKQTIMKKYSAFLLSVVAATTVSAKQINESQAAAIAQKYMPETSAKKMARAKSAAGSDSENAPYYVFNYGNNAGFVIISGDDSLTELIGYSYTGHFSTDNMPQNLRSWLGTYSEYVSKVQDGEAAPIKRASATGTPVVDSFVKTKWNQDEPFNRMCPAYYADKTEILPTGCVATTIAQVMKYYEYPSQGKGSISYSYYQANDYASYQQISVDFSQSTYDWDNMLDAYQSYYSGNNLIHEYTDTQAEAVALLMRDCGAAVMMSYGLDGSGAYDINVPYGMATYFGYDAALYMRSSLTDTQFLDKIKDELDDERPVVFCGAGDLGGHCFVIDGYDSNDMLSVNWGWGGLSDGWYDMNLMNPVDLGIGGGGGGFVYQQSITTMRPDTDGEGRYGNTPLTAYNYFRTDVESIEKGDPLTAKLSTAINYSAYFYNGYVAVGVFDRNGNRVAEPVDTKQVSIGSYYAAYDLSFTVQDELENLVDGEYMLYPVSKENRDGSSFDWMRLADAGRIYITVEGNTITVGEPVYKLDLVEVTGDNSIPFGGTLTAKALLRNNSVETAAGAVEFTITETETGKRKMLKDASFTVFSGEEAEASTEFLITNAGIFEIGKSYTVAVTNMESSGTPFELVMPENPSFTFTVSDQAGIGDINNDNLRLYPNPVADILNADTPYAIKSIQVYGSDGRLAKASEGTSSIDMSSCPAGYYIVVITTDNGVIRQSVVKR